MPIVSQNNGLLAEFAVFPVEPANQADLVERIIQSIESTLKQHPGFISGTVFRSHDGLRVTSYVQWVDQASYRATQPLLEFDSRMFICLKFLTRNPKAASCISHLTWMD